MENTIGIAAVHLSSFQVVGFKARTTNQAEMEGRGVISSMWERVYQESVLEEIPGKTSPVTYAIYTDYESDENGEYTFAIGTAAEGREVPKDLAIFAVPETSYVVFTSRRGPIREVVLEAWQYIWEWSRQNKRAFAVDFELYDERCQDPDNSQVDIYISV
ncbi:GyrI-like domain-containing protein [Paenibacillus turpanensis]|uniref:GyrI-like domain-containing protein n=1 Tax=Paenibacillus turpanensis TaxID=2689078 RepID=UPI00140D5EA9|nr:GyrI-like domain-containing protein [Paenibacillus turpanensis]